jgi:glycine C-acetyltransferase
MSARFLAHLTEQLRGIESQGLAKRERLIASPQAAVIAADGREVINLCANNYLGLAHDPRIERAAAEGLARWGYGLSSVRFICGTQDIHRQLERALADFLRVEDAILYSSCFDANGGLFETLLGEEDAVISDALNHASIIDGIRLCKAKRFRYLNNDLADLERQLLAARECRFRLIATDGVFSMDGSFADLAGVTALAARHDALVMVDDSHAVGFIGEGGRGTPALQGVEGRVDMLTGTFGKALGGASGGYVAGRQAVIDLLRQRSRPYLFSNSLAPMIAATTLTALELVRGGDAARAHLMLQTQRFRRGLSAAGFTIAPGSHPIVPVMLGDAQLAARLAAGLFEEGIYAVGFSYPVVPMGKARIRCQISAAHTAEHIDRAVSAFARVGARLTIVGSGTVP